MILVKTFDAYTPLALRTCKPGDYLYNIQHAMMGMVGEAGELVESYAAQDGKMVGEIGDAFWYCALMASTLKIKFSQIILAAEDELVINSKRFVTGPPSISMLTTAAALCDLVKKNVIYGKPVDEPVVVAHLVSFVAHLIYFAHIAQKSLLQVLSINITKLAERYPDKFDAERAINRDYGAESKATGEGIA